MAAAVITTVTTTVSMAARTRTTMPSLRGGRDPGPGITGKEDWKGNQIHQTIVVGILTIVLT